MGEDQSLYNCDNKKKTSTDSESDIVCIGEDQAKNVLNTSNNIKGSNRVIDTNRIHSGAEFSMSDNNEKYNSNLTGSIDFSYSNNKSHITMTNRTE